MEQSDTPEPAGSTKLQLQTRLQTRYHYYHLHTKQIPDRRQTFGCITFLKAHKYTMRLEWTQRLCMDNMYRTILYDLQGSRSQWSALYSGEFAFNLQVSVVSLASYNNSVGHKGHFEAKQEGRGGAVRK